MTPQLHVGTTSNAGFQHR